MSGVCVVELKEDMKMKALRILNRGVAKVWGRGLIVEAWLICEGCVVIYWGHWLKESLHYVH